MDPAGVVHVAVVALGLAVLLGVFVVSAFDVSLARQGTSVAQHLNRWSRRYPLFAAGLIFLFGAVLGHFFSHG
jgi:hypothetical protein